MRRTRAGEWCTFLKAHADVIAAPDFFTTEVWTTHGLVTHYVLFVIEHATRVVHVAGITTSPDGVVVHRSSVAQSAISRPHDDESCGI